MNALRTRKAPGTPGMSCEGGTFGPLGPELLRLLLLSLFLLVFCVVFVFCVVASSFVFFGWGGCSFFLLCLCSFWEGGAIYNSWRGGPLLQG